MNDHGAEMAIFPQSGPSKIRRLFVGMLHHVDSSLRDIEAAKPPKRLQVTQIIKLFEHLKGLLWCLCRFLSLLLLVLKQMCEDCKQSNVRRFDDALRVLLVLWRFRPRSSLITDMW